MSKTIISENVRSEYLNFDLTESYRSKHFTKNFNSHLNLLFDCASAIDTNDTFKPTILDFNDNIYWETEAYIFENLDDLDADFKNELYNLEDELYCTIKNKLGINYRSNDSLLDKVIDNTIKSTLNALKFNYFSRKDEFINPWMEARKILTEDNVLHTFITDLNVFDDLGFDVGENESEEIRFKKIGILGRGNRDEFTYGTFRDLIKLRNTVFGIIDENASSSSTPISTTNIISELRKMGINELELTDNEVKNWLIYPLKKALKIGSCREGYFVLGNCHDLSISYYSHLNVLKGYLKTLEDHRKIAVRSGCGSDLSEHLNILNLNP